jgi:hypothetical protein
MPSERGKARRAAEGKSDESFLLRTIERVKSCKINKEGRQSM